MNHTARRIWACSAVSFALMFWSVSAVAQGGEISNSGSANEAQLVDQDRSSDVPRRHFRDAQVAELGPRESERIYQIVRQALDNGYAASGLEDLEGYQDLIRYNAASYASASHGNYYLNNYSNDIARDYGKFEKAGVLPEGAIIYKDSFSVTEIRQGFSGGLTRRISLGPMFVMRKMEQGFNPVSGDWRYIEVAPDGRVLGMTKGEGAENVEYCIGCHLAREKYDHLFFVPEAFR